MSIEAPILTSHNLFIGEDRVLEFTVVDENSAAVNITGYALEWVMRDDATSATAVITKTTGAGITITNGPAGLCEVAIARADTLALGAGTYFHTLRRTDAGLARALSFGDVMLKQAATR